METPDNNSIVLNVESKIKYFLRFYTHQQRPFFWRQYLPRTRPYYCDSADNFRSSYQGSGWRGRWMTGMKHIAASPAAKLPWMPGKTMEPSPPAIYDQDYSWRWKRPIDRVILDEAEQRLYNDSARNAFVLRQIQVLRLVDQQKRFSPYPYYPSTVTSNISKKDTAKNRYVQPATIRQN